MRILPLAVLAVWLAPCAHAQDAQDVAQDELEVTVEPDPDYDYEYEVESDSAPAPTAAAPAKKRAPAVKSSCELQTTFGSVQYQKDGASAWTPLAEKESRQLANRDILKTDEKSYALLALPGRCVLKLEESSVLILSGALHRLPEFTLVKGTLLARCLPGQRLRVKSSLMTLDARGAMIGVSYDYATAIAAAANYQASAQKKAGTLQLSRNDPSSGETSLELKPGFQLILSKQMRDPQPVEMQNFFLDYSQAVSALSVPPARKAKVSKPKSKPAPEAAKQEPKEPAVPRLEINRFETKREQERQASETSVSFKDKYKKTAQ